LAVYLGGNGRWANFNAVLDPRGPRPAPYYNYTSSVNVSTLSTEEKALLGKIMEAAENDAIIGPDDEDLFYTVFQKLVDI
jgi:hypothetical protein